ncbi:glycosyltransferase [Botrimarina sp.]|uniref:glycosyltransferase n=1 Tax=Botrimarina sp. TaxID=2795802 RepID=UPI0032EF9A45
MITSQAPTTEPAKQPRTDAIRVGFVLHKMQVAGAEVLVAEMIRRLAGAIEPTVLCLDSVGRLGEQLIDEGVEVVALGRREGIDRTLPARLAGASAERGVQVWHAHQYTPFFYCALAKRHSPQVKLVFTEHGRHYPDVVGWKRHWANRLWFGRQADAVTACCGFAADAIVQTEGIRSREVRVVPNGIDADRFGGSLSAEARRGLRAELGLDERLQYVVTPARFHPVKDHPTLVKAFATVARSRDDARLLLLGEGPERERVERLVAELGLVDRVQFWGVRSDVDRVLAAADLFALSSVSEAASITILEAMASQLPIVATRVGGTPELVRDGVDGLLTPRGDAPALAYAILRLLSDPASAERMGRAGRERVLDRFGLDQAVEAYSAVFRETLGGAPKN